MDSSFTGTRRDFKHLLESLRHVNSTAKTSVITLVVPPEKQIAQISSFLTTEYSTADNIKNRVNRLSVLAALRTLQEKIKLYTKIPKNGLLLLAGEVMITRRDVKEKMISLAVEPPKPIRQFIYRCAGQFCLDDLNYLIEEEGPKTGVVILTGNDYLIATICGCSRIIHTKRDGIDLQKKHGRGGQSKLRFERLAEESHHNYLKKVAELINQYFISNNLPNVDHLLVAGNAQLKNRLVEESYF